ncbi:hypothetical protein [Bradyrhizobium sp.]|uniref:hypothetical protein n=1 Tax=Bradyrhizobium sp. TaxID=376 RepID=UPI0025BCE9FD|nr:hypothetical protein [Bradyrhizobium sp.]
MSAWRAKRTVEVRMVEPGVIVQRGIGALEAAEEIVEVRMRTARNTAPALRLTFHEGELHGISAGEEEDG